METTKLMKMLIENKFNHISDEIMDCLYITFPVLGDANYKYKELISQTDEDAYVYQILIPYEKKTKTFLKYVYGSDFKYLKKGQNIPFICIADGFVGVDAWFHFSETEGIQGSIYQDEGEIYYDSLPEVDNEDLADSFVNLTERQQTHVMEAIEEDSHLLRILGIPHHIETTNCIMPFIEILRWDEKPKMSEYKKHMERFYAYLCSGSKKISKDAKKSLQWLRTRLLVELTDCNGEKETFKWVTGAHSLHRAWIPTIERNGKLVKQLYGKKFLKKCTKNIIKLGNKYC